MKKNRTLRVGVLLLALTLITSCFVGGTFAKYTTYGNGNDAARVAKFGVVVTAEGSTFADKYVKDDETFTLAANSVVSFNGDKVVAPGTKGNMATTTITGTPEVAVRVTYEATFDLKGWKLGETYYCPLVITIGDGEDAKVIDGADYSTDLAGFKNAVEAAINAYSKDYKANEDLATAEGPALSWKWPFAVNDALDTALGNQAAAGAASEVELTVKTTVTQID